MIGNKMNLKEIIKRLLTKTPGNLNRISYTMTDFQLFITYNKFNYLVSFDLFSLDNVSHFQFQYCITDLKQLEVIIMAKKYQTAIDIHNAATPPELNITKREVEIIKETKNKLNKKS